MSAASRSACECDGFFCVVFCFFAFGLVVDAAVRAFFFLFAVSTTGAHICVRCVGLFGCNASGRASCCRDCASASSLICESTFNCDAGDS
ncbi:hypothetical protein GQ600_24568 [Phytophthora cactorum]|nr:hypothetical protein GQ600_24568 [Phytophthora cactorum]